MAQGSGSARRSTRALGLATLLCLLLAHAADAATYIVGDSGGWTFNMASWTRGKRFRAGDVLVFKYRRWMHDVTAVNEAGYNGCFAPIGSRFYISGNDRITLARGRNYFICSIIGHCQDGMKIAVDAD